MKYRLNETPLKTTNGFKINDIELKLDINETNFNDYLINKDITIKKEIKKDFNSRIGLKSNKYYLINIDIDKNYDDLIIEYTFDDNNFLADEIVLNIENNIKSNIIFKYNSKTKCIHNFKLIINSKEYSNSNITILNNVSDDSIIFSSIESNISDNSKVICNYIDLCGSIRVSNYYSLINTNGYNEFNNIYYGCNKDRIDMNYYMILNGIKSEANMYVTGALDNNSYKSFKGTIDFKTGSKKSIGNELEESIILSNDSKSKSMPMLLCSEEDVIGNHGVSTGKIDNEKLFYLMSRGLSNKDASKLIIKGNYNKVLDKISNSYIVDEILKIIEEKL